MFLGLCLFVFVIGRILKWLLKSYSLKYIRLAVPSHPFENRQNLWFAYFPFSVCLLVSGCVGSAVVHEISSAACGISSCARGILVPWPGIEPTSATLQGRSSTAGLSEKSASDSLLATEIWQRWTGCLNVPTVPFNWLWANPKDNYPRQARLNHVSLPEESLVLLWNKIREMANTASLAGFEERSCHELYSCKEVSPAKSLKNLGSGSFPSQNSRWELSPATTWVFSFVKPWAERSAKPGPNFRPTETRDNKCVLLKPLGLGQFVIQK